MTGLYFASLNARLILVHVTDDIEKLMGSSC